MKKLNRKSVSLLLLRRSAPAPYFHPPFLIFQSLPPPGEVNLILDVAAALDPPLCITWWYGWQSKGCGFISSRAHWRESSQPHYISRFNSQKIQWVGWLSLHLPLTTSNITPLTKVAVFIPGDHYQHPYENLLGRKNLLH